MDQSISREDIQQCWEQVLRVTSGWSSDVLATPPQALKKLKDLSFSDSEEITEAKMKHRIKIGVYRPEIVNQTENRTTRKFSLLELRVVLLVGILRKKFPSAAYSDITTHLNTFREVGFSPSLPAPQSANIAYARLRNRIFNTFVGSLGEGQVSSPPRTFLCAIRLKENQEPIVSRSTLYDWDEVHHDLSQHKWHILGVDPALSYMHDNLRQLFEARPIFAKGLQGYKWFRVYASFENDERIIVLIIGFPINDLDNPSVRPIATSLRKYAQNEKPIKVSDFPGLDLLLSSTLEITPSVNLSSSLSVLCEIVSSLSKNIDYCVAFVPDRTELGEVIGLRAIGKSLGFPETRLEPNPKFVGGRSNWNQWFDSVMYFTPIAEDDTRIPYISAPKSVAFFPTRTGEGELVGLLYLAGREKLAWKNHHEHSEVGESIRMISLLCGEIISEKNLETSSISRLIERATQLRRNSYNKRFDDLEATIDYVIDRAPQSIEPTKIPFSWIYLLTLTVLKQESRDPKLKAFSDWVVELAVNKSIEYITNSLKTIDVSKPVTVAVCKLSEDQYVFAVTDLIVTPDDKHLKVVAGLHKSLAEIGSNLVDFYPWAIALPYVNLFADPARKKEPGDELVKIVQESSQAGPYYNQGHLALQDGDLDSARSNFETAIRLAPESWYARKHLAETRFLQGKLPQAIEECNKSIEKNPNYISALALRADCYSAENRVLEAIREYERIIGIGNDPGILIRYGISLSNFRRELYEDAISDPELAGREFNSEKYLEAIDKFEKARKLLNGANESSGNNNKSLIRIQFHLGMVYFKEGLIEKAIEELSLGRKLSPKDDFLNHALALVRNAILEK